MDVRSQKGADTTLAVAVEFVDSAGIRRTVPIGLIAASPTWRPSPILPVVTNPRSPLIPHRASFRFTPSGSSDWSVDDLYVRPVLQGLTSAMQHH